MPLMFTEMDAKLMHGKTAVAKSSRASAEANEHCVPIYLPRQTPTLKCGDELNEQAR